MINIMVAALTIYASANVIEPNERILGMLHAISLQGPDKKHSGPTGFYIQVTFYILVIKI